MATFTLGRQHSEAQFCYIKNSWLRIPHNRSKEMSFFNRHDNA